MAKNEAVAFVGGLMVYWQKILLSVIFGVPEGAIQTAIDANELPRTYRGASVGIMFDHFRKWWEGKGHTLTLTELGEVLVDASVPEYLDDDILHDIRDLADNELHFGVEAGTWKRWCREGKVRAKDSSACGPQRMHGGGMIACAAAEGMTLRPRPQDAKKIYLGRMKAAEQAAEAAENHELTGLAAVLAAKDELDQAIASEEAASAAITSETYGDLHRRALDGTLSEADKKDFVMLIHSGGLTNDKVVEHAKAIADERQLRELDGRLAELRADHEAKRRELKETEARHERERKAAVVESDKAFRQQSEASHAGNRIRDLHAKYPMLFSDGPPAAMANRPRRKATAAVDGDSRDGRLPSVL